MQIPRPLRLSFSLVALLLLVGVRPASADLLAPFTPAAPAEAIIPEKRVSLADFGGVPDGATLNTAAFAKAIAALSSAGGGTLVVPPGIWLTGPIELRSRIRLHLETGALIQFSRDPAQYPMRLFDARGEKSVDTTSPISGEHLEDVAITGSGIIDGDGDAWRLVKKSKVTDSFWKNLVASGGVTDAKGAQWWPSQAAMGGEAAVRALRKKGALDPALYEPYRVCLRPRLLNLLDCRRVRIEGVTFRNSPGWTLHPWLCEDLVLRDLKIFNARWAQNSDAMDIDSCRRVLVKDCTVDTGDDGICIKSGFNETGRRLGVPTEDVLVEGCTVYDGHGGFTIGSEMSGGVRNVLVRDCTFIGTALGLRFKTARGRGGVVENIHIRDIRMSGIEGAAIDFNFFYAGEDAQSSPVPPVTEETPVFRNILIENVVSLDSRAAFTLRGLPEMPIQNLTLRNVSISALRGADLAYAQGIDFDRVRIRVGEGKPLTVASVTHSNLALLP